jgi:hypothetical protein
VLRLSGVYDKVHDHGFQVKRGAHFLWKNDTWLLDWSMLVDAEAWLWQVDRAAFDVILLRNAAQQGAKVIEEAKVTDAVFNGDRPSAVQWQSRDGQCQTSTFDFLVDASGRAGCCRGSISICASTMSNSAIPRYGHIGKVLACIPTAQKAPSMSFPPKKAAGSGTSRWEKNVSVVSVTLCPNSFSPPTVDAMRHSPSVIWSLSTATMEWLDCSMGHEGSLS